MEKNTSHSMLHNGIGSLIMIVFRIFGMADKDLSGKLSMMEFQQAYDLLFDRKLENAHVTSELFVRAIRYGDQLIW